LTSGPPNLGQEAKPSLPALRGLLLEFIAFARWRSAEVVSLMGAAAVLEGFGLVMVAPFLILLGIGENTARRAGGPAHLLINALAHFGFVPSVPHVLAAYVLLIAIYSAVCSRRDILSAQLREGFLEHLRGQLFHDIGASEWAFLAGIRSAKFTHSLVSDLARVNVAIQSVLQNVATAVVALAYLLVAVRLSWSLTLLAVVVGGLFIVILRRQHRLANALGWRHSSTTRQIHSEIAEFLAGLKLAKSNNAEAALSRRFASIAREIRDQTTSFARQQVYARSVVRFGAAIALALLIWVSIGIASATPATVLILMLIFARLFPVLSQFQQQHEQLLHSLPAYLDFVEMRASCRAAAEPPQNQSEYSFLQVLRLHAVGYRHTADGTEVLSDISLQIPARNTIAVIGPSGAGKSTLADLLVGLIEPSAGRITVDDRALSDRRTWRRSVAYVPQEIFLFNASVRENLLWGTTKAEESDLWRVLDLAAAAEFVRALPRGLNTIVGERGIRLSGGERQRLAIARALLRSPQLLVLDEATSALDRSNEQRIQNALTRLHGHLTIVVIAHRLATVRAADQIVVLNQGRITERGSYETLSANHESYLARSEAKMDA